MTIENSMIIGAEEEEYRNSMNENNHYDIYDEDMAWWYYKQKGVI